MKLKISVVAHVVATLLIVARVDASELSHDEAIERIIGASIPVPPQQEEVNAAASLSEVGMTATELLSRVYTGVTKIEDIGKNQARVYAVVGNMNCVLLMQNTEFKAELTGGTKTGWKVQQLDCK